MPADSFPFRVWSGLLAPEHHSRIGPALWTFLWLIRRTTRERGDGLGLVLGGKPIKAKQISQEIGRHIQTVKADLARLRKWGYIQVERRTPYGLILLVAKSKRWPERSNETTTSPETERSSGICTSLPERSSETCTREVAKTIPAKKRVIERTVKSESQEGQTDVTDRLRLDGEPWKVLQIHSLPAECQDFIDLVNRTPQGKGETLLQYCERVMQTCTANHVRWAEAFHKVKKTLEKNLSAAPRPPAGTTARGIVLMRRVRDGVATDDEKIELKHVNELLGNNR